MANRGPAAFHRFGALRHSRLPCPDAAGELPQPFEIPAVPNPSGTLARRNTGGWCARAAMRQRPSEKERGKSASGKECDC
jgi:hypothetical protein